MMLACRGATNKDAAKALGLSEATVKFHLGNPTASSDAAAVRKRPRLRMRLDWP